MTLNDLIDRQAAERPNAKAIIFKSVSLTYKELHRQILILANVLAGRGLRAGEAYGIVMRNSSEFVITFFALARLGARAVPVNFLLKPDEISYIFADAGVVGAITQPPFLGAVLQVKKKLSAMRDVIVAGSTAPAGPAAKPETVGVLSFENLMASQPGLDQPAQAAPDDVAMIIYTSGTTGKPKGALLTHRNFVANVEQCLGLITLKARDTFLCLLPMFHSFAWTVCVLVPLYLGSCIVIVESVLPFGPVIKQIFRHRVKIFVAVPPIYAALLRVPFWRPFKFLNPLRLCVSGAAALPRPVHAKFEAKFGVPLLEGYGLTEASPVVSFNPERKRVPGSVGQPLPGVEVRLVDELGRPLTGGEVGEICIRGENVMKGYYHDEEATGKAFLDEDHQWLRTGDLGFLDADGYLHISDRKKDLIIVKGLNVYPKEVEDILMTHPAVLEAAVIGIPDETGDEIIRAFVTLKKGSTVEKQELLKLCRGSLASYKCPKDLDIRRELPKNTLGKILKRELRKL